MGRGGSSGRCLKWGGGECGSLRDLSKNISKQGVGKGESCSIIPSPLYTILQNKRMRRCEVAPTNNFSRNKLYIWNLQITRFKMIYDMFVF